MDKVPWNREIYKEFVSLCYLTKEEEITHMEALHRAAVLKIDTYKREKGSPPAEMLAVYEYLHKRDIQKLEKIATMQALYKK